MPLSAMVCHPWARICSTILTKFKVSILTHYEGMIGYIKCKNGVVWDRQTFFATEDKVSLR